MCSTPRSSPYKESAFQETWQGLSQSSSRVACFDPATAGFLVHRGVLGIGREALSTFCHKELWNGQLRYVTIQNFP